MSSANSLYARARLLLAEKAIESADIARGIVGDVSTDMRPGERTRTVRRHRLASLSMSDIVVLVELSEGASWETVAAGQGIDVDEAKRIYGPTWQMWLDGELDDDDEDYETRAAVIDSWYNRHREPWESPEEAKPAAQVLVDAENRT